MWSYLTWTSPGVPRRRSVWAPPPSPALGTKLSHKHNHTLATPGLQLCASHRREMGKTLHQGDRINLITNRLAKASLTPAVPRNRERRTVLIYTRTYWNTIFKWIFYGVKPFFFPYSFHFSLLINPLTSLYLCQRFVHNTWNLESSTFLLTAMILFFMYISNSVHRLSTSLGFFKVRLPLVMWYGNDP